MGILQPVYCWACAREIAYFIAKNPSGEHEVRATHHKNGTALCLKLPPCPECGADSHRFRGEDRSADVAFACSKNKDHNWREAPPKD